MLEDLKEFYLTWVKMVEIDPINRIEKQKGTLLAQKLLELSNKIQEQIKDSVIINKVN